MTVIKGTTVGQLVVAESHLSQLPTPTRILTAMGSQLSAYKAVQPNQTILLEDGRSPQVMQQPQVAGLGRLEALWRQQGWVATDEMAFYMRMLGQPNLTNTTPPIIMHDCLDPEAKFVEWLNVGIDQYAHTNTSFALHTVCLYEHHWFPISAKFADSTITLTTTLPELPMLQQWAAATYGNGITFHYKVPLEAFPADCGFQAMAWIMAQELGTRQAYPMSVDEAIKWRTIFCSTPGEPQSQ